MYPQSTFHVPKPAAFIEINISLFTYLSQQLANFSERYVNKEMLISMNAAGFGT
jgi:hypothetical protein